MQEGFRLQVTTSENGEIPTQGFCLSNFAMVKASSGGGSEMEVDSRSPRERNVSFPLVFTLNLSQISFETGTVWKGISFF